MLSDDGTGAAAAGNAPGGPPDADAPVPYLEESTEVWTRAVADTFTQRPAGDGWEYGGACPRCSHRTSTVIAPTVVMKGFNPWRHQARGPATFAVLTVRCDCGVDHAAGRRGCGAHGSLLDVTFG